MVSHLYEVATFNIRYDNVNDNENAWIHRKDQVAGMLQYYAWDIVGMQEVCGNQLDDLLSMTNEYEYEGIGRENDHASEHVPVFFKRERFEREDGGTFWLSLTPERSSLSWGSRCKRICTWLRLKDKRNGTRFVFLNTHLDHVSEEARFQGAKMITAFVDRFNGEFPVLLTGDFNAKPNERCYGEITSKLFNARLAATEGHYGPIGTFNGFNYQVSMNELQEIDYIFVNEKVSVSKTRTVVDSQDRKFPSDHFPVAASVRFV